MCVSFLYLCLFYQGCLGTSARVFIVATAHCRHLWHSMCTAASQKAAACCCLQYLFTSSLCLLADAGHHEFDYVARSGENRLIMSKLSWAVASTPPCLCLGRDLVGGCVCHSVSDLRAKRMIAWLPSCVHACCACTGRCDINPVSRRDRELGVAVAQEELCHFGPSGYFMVEDLGLKPLAKTLGLIAVLSRLCWWAAQAAASLRSTAQ